MEKAHSLSSPSAWQILAEFNLPSQPGINRLAPDYVAVAVHPLNLSPTDLERLKKVVAETVQNTFEHDNRYRPDLPLSIRLRIFVQALDVPSPGWRNATIGDAETPILTANDLEQELSQGWGVFLIEREVEDIRIRGKDTYYSIDLFLYRE